MKRFSSFKILLCVLLLSVIVQTGAANSPNWNLVGTWTLDFVCNSGCTGISFYYITITSQTEDGTFSGTGHTSTNPSLPVIANGTVTGSTFALKIVYEVPSSGVDSHSSTFTGKISSDGKLSGSGITAANEIGDFTTSYGIATPIGDQPPIMDQETTLVTTQSEPDITQLQNQSTSENWINNILSQIINLLEKIFPKPYQPMEPYIPIPYHPAPTIHLLPTVQPIRYNPGPYIPVPYSPPTRY